MGRPVDLHRIEPARLVAIADHEAGATDAAPGDRTRTAAATATLTARLAELQEILWARQREKVLVVLQGIDTSGKGGTIKHVFGAVNPAGLRVVSFKSPSEAEMGRDYLWRIHAAVPASGEISVFDRSHYEDVLVVRVAELVAEERWKRRFDHINAFEEMLTDEGTTIVKFFLHISEDEQKERLQARLDDPVKHWKFRVGDLDTRADWDAYETAFSDAITRTSTPHAPWFVIPANKKWYRNWAVASIMVDTLERLDLTWPGKDADHLAVEID